MFVLVDILYLLLLPFLLIFAAVSRLRGHPPRRGIAGRFGYGKPLNPHPKRVLLHAVSVGEVNAIRTLVSDLLAQDYDVVVCVTTDTGIERAIELYSNTCHVTRFPFDFSFAVRRFIQRIKPTLVALVELEVWPNVISICAKKKIPIVVINGRLSERSYKRYKLVKPLLLSTFRRLAAIGMQNELYAGRVRSLGATNVSVLGTMKWDNAIIADSIDGVDSLAEDLHIDRTKLLVVAGSTAPDEHLLLKDSIPEGVQLLCAPRRPEWFDDAATSLAPCNRRKNTHREQTDYFLLDTIGELEKAYALADIVVIGRSFAPLHGSDPTSSIALGKPTIIGPNVSDFEEMVEVLVNAGALIQCNADELKRTIQQLLENQELRSQMRNAGREIIRTNQGATKRYLEFIAEHTPHA